MKNIITRRRGLKALRWVLIVELVLWEAPFFGSVVYCNLAFGTDWEWTAIVVGVYMIGFPVAAFLVWRGLVRAVGAIRKIMQRPQREKHAMQLEAALEGAEATVAGRL